MTLAEVVLITTVVTASFFVGVIAAMLGVIQRVLNQLEYATFTRVMQGIITSGRKSPVIWSLLLIPIFSAVLVLYLSRDEMDGITFTWVLLGLVLFIAGPILVSRFGNEPYYDEVMRWRPDKVVSGWEDKRLRWFCLNLWRFGIGAMACVAFAVALTQGITG